MSIVHDRVPGPRRALARGPRRPRGPGCSSNSRAPGAKALTSSHLDPALGRALEAVARTPGCGSHSSAAPDGTPTAVPRRAPGVRGAHHPGNVWLHSATTCAPERLLDLDFTALGTGDPRTFDATLQVSATRATRSRSSAPTASATACRAPGPPPRRNSPASAVAGAWEVAHLGGHRFSPTLLVLPYGYAYGRAEAHAVKEILQGVREGRVVTKCVGNSAWERPGQAAELAVRRACGERAAEALGVVRTDRAPRWEVTVAHTDGRLWRVIVAQGASLPPRPGELRLRAGFPGPDGRGGRTGDARATIPVAC